MFSYNTANDGGAIEFQDNSYIYFEGDSSPVFSNNTAQYGGAIHSYDNCYIFFEGNSAAVFSDNIADHNGGAIYSDVYSCIFFEGNSSPAFNYNTAKYAGAIESQTHSCIYFKGSSSPVFSYNIAKYGGAIFSYYDSYISSEGNSSPVFSNNTAQYGGVIHTSGSQIYFKGNSSTAFNDNTATSFGGAVFSTVVSKVSFEEFSVVVFRNNIAEYGGAVFVGGHSDIIFSDNSRVKFGNNNATFGATVFSNNGSKIIVIRYSTVIFNDHSVKWCNNTCLPYTGQGNVFTIDSNGVVWCSDRDQKAFICPSEKCYCNKLENLLYGLKNNTLVNITDTVTLSSRIGLSRLNNISISGHNNITVICVNGGGLELLYCSNFTIEGITWIGCGNYEYIMHIPVIDIQHSSFNIIIQKCTLQYSLGMVISLLYDIQNGSVNINHCNFMNNNHYKDHGVAISCTMKVVEIDININNCNFSYNGNAKSIIHFDNSSIYHLNNIYLNASNFHDNQGISIHLTKNYILNICGDVLFENNVAENAAGIYVSAHSTVIFNERSKTKFINNHVEYRSAAVFLTNHSNLIFEQSSVVTFTDNKASIGTIYCEDNSNVTFKGTCEVTFSHNSATQYGAAIYSSGNSHVTFTGNSKVTFINNVVSSNDIDLQHGGIICSEKNGFISFEQNSYTIFSSNIADFGAAILSFHVSNISFKDHSTVMINNNIARSCGVLTSNSFCDITFNDNSMVIYDSNTVSCTLANNFEFSASSTMCTLQRTNVIFSGHSLTIFINNKAVESRVAAFSESNVIIKDHSAVIFKDNVAHYSSGGAFTCYNNTNVTIKGNSNVTFNNNQASQSGGAVYSYNMCKITFQDNSTSSFINNTARNNGGAILSSQISDITFEGNSVVTFYDNTADKGGVFHFTKSTISFKETSAVSFYANIARQNGGVGYLSSNSKMKTEGTTKLKFGNNIAEQNAGVLYFTNSNIWFTGKSTTLLTYNRATLNGGAILADDTSNITLGGNSVLLIVNNEATQSGGAGYFISHCNFIMEENAMVTFDNNTAFQGGAVWTDDDIKLIFKGNSTAFFYNNLAIEAGGAVKSLSNSSIVLKDYIFIEFTNNSAQYGGAIFSGTTAAVFVNGSDKHCIEFINNLAKISGNSVYQDVSQLCTSSCLYNMGINHDFVNTPPNELKFSDPAICIDTDNDTRLCNSYYVQNIMLGKPIIIPACVVDYYNQTVDSLQFLVQNETNLNYSMSGPKHVLLSSNTFEGISIIGKQSLSKSTNFSINITLNTALYSDWKQISVNLIIELSPCHPGFWHYPNSKRCECYNASDIVFCSGSNSTIKRGYWFGSVTGKPTITFCPINYCNFTCCETSNGYYHLSPLRDNQCRLHRSGTACGSCEEGYTLSFDSFECIHMKQCSIGQMILVIALILLYWILIIGSVFSMMHFKVGIGYLYALTYYYSVVDLLLNQNFYLSSVLSTTINVMSSTAKIIPQFLGQFCFIRNMSGIDQQFIHYIHPVAISLFLVMITVLSKRSRRLSSFISKGIIHVICFLLLLSYTSLATTSLLLMRPLIFHDVDKVYTYLSPDIKYFHGRHLAYVIVAVLFTVVIVIGLPLLLILEPFLNSKINFVKVKPLLDQFQGHYKDKYRFFAAYYMICRLVIITIIIANSSNDFAFQYSLITVCVIIALIHQLSKPYSNSLLNDFDGAILHILVLISVLPLVEFFNNFDSNLFMGITFVLVILPLLIFITMSVMINKKNIKGLPGYCYAKYTQLCIRSKHYDEIPLNETDDDDDDECVNVIDDSSRVNATICDV